MHNRCKTINNLAGTFKPVHQSLLKFKKSIKVYFTMMNMKCPKYNNKLTCTKTQVIVTKLNLQKEAQPTSLLRHTPINAHVGNVRNLAM